MPATLENLKHIQETAFVSLKVFRPGSNYFNEIDIFPLLLISGRPCRTIDNWDFFVLCLLF